MKTTRREAIRAVQSNNNNFFLIRSFINSTLCVAEGNSQVWEMTLELRSYAAAITFHSDLRESESSAKLNQWNAFKCIVKMHTDFPLTLIGLE